MIACRVADQAEKMQRFRRRAAVAQIALRKAAPLPRGGRDRQGCVSAPRSMSTLPGKLWLRTSWADREAGGLGAGAASERGR